MKESGSEGDSSDDDEPRPEADVAELRGLGFRD